MNDARFDHMSRLLAHSANRRKVLRSVATGALGIGLARSVSSAQQPTDEATQTPDPLALEYPLLSDTERAFLLTLVSPRPSDVNVERPDRVVRSSPDVLFFSLPQAKAAGLFNAQQIAALPSDPRLVSRGTVLQQPPAGGERGEIGRYIDNTTIFFSDEDSVDVEQYWQTYGDLYYPNLDQRDLGIDGVPNGFFVEYGGTFPDGRDYQLVSGVAQFDQFLILTSNVRFDGDPSVNEVKRVIDSLHDRLRQPEVNQDLLDVTAASPSLFDLGPTAGSATDAKSIPDPWFVTPLFENGVSNGYVTPFGGNDQRGTAEGGRVVYQYEHTRGFPIGSTDHRIIQRYRPTMFDTEEAARADFDQAVANAGAQPGINIFDTSTETSPLPMLIGQYDIPFGDDESLVLPVYDVLILNGQFVIGSQIIGGVPVEGTPTAGYRGSMGDFGDAVTTYILSGLGRGPDFDADAFRTILNSTLDVQSQCAENPTACSE